MNTSVHSIPNVPDNYCKIACSLLPTIEMDSHSLQISSNKNFNISYVDRYGNRWNLDLVCANTLQLNVKIEDMDLLHGNFQVVLEILHDLPLKTIMQHIPFKLPGPPNYYHISKKIADLCHFQNGGFVTKDGLVRIKIGIGPEDPITERNCYQNTLARYRNRISMLKYELTDWKKFSIGYFRMEKCPDFRSKSSKTAQSAMIMDDHGVRWQLKVSINEKKCKGFVGVSLIKVNGDKGWYDYFIELIHLESEKQNRCLKGCYLFDAYPLEFPQFMTTAFLNQFMDGGTLRLRFGTKMESEK